MLLSLDISTSIIGWALTEYPKSVTLTYGAWDMRNKNKYKNVFDKAQFIKSELIKLTQQYQITKIIIEEPFKVFSGSKAASSANTMAVLQKFNGIISWIVFDLLKTIPDYIGVKEARTKCKIKVPKGADAKETAMRFLLDTEPRFVVAYTKSGNPAPKFYDMSDAIVLLKSQL